MELLDPVTALERLGAAADGSTLRRTCNPWQLRVAFSQGRVVHLGRNGYALPGAAARRRGVDVRYADLPASAVHGTRTTRVQTVVDCARTLPFDEALTVADSALREGRVTRAQLIEAAQRSPRTGSARALRVVELADARAATRSSRVCAPSRSMSPD